MMKLIKKLLEIIKKLYRNIWFRTILFISLFLIFYAVREKVDFTSNTRTVLNLVFMGVFFVQLYQRINEKRISIVRFLFILVAVFILNKFYDQNIFFSVFKIKLNYAVILTGSAIFLYIIGSKVFLLISNRKAEDLKLKNEGASFETQDKGDSSIRKEYEYDDIESSKININDSEYTNSFRKKQAEVYTKRNGEYQTNLDQDVKPQMDFNQNVEPEPYANEQSTKLKIGAIIFICFMILLLTAFSIISLFNDDVMDKFSSIESTNRLGAFISLIGLLFLFVFIWAVAATTLIRLGQIILNIIKNKDLQSNYLLNASAFLIVSFFITKQYNISLDKILDSIIQGNILSFPILILILLPLFFSLLQNLETLIKKNEKLKEKTVKLIYDLIFGIIEALLNFIKFTTADFLISIQDIVKEDLDYKTETEEQFSKDLGEQTDGKTSNQSNESNKKQE